MIKQIDTQILNVTRALAEEFATMPAWIGERPLLPRRVDLLSEKIAQGLFHSPLWAVAWLDGKQYRINGQHSSHALATCPNLPADLTVTILRFKVDSERELADLFHQD